MKIIIINGPNINLLGKREPEIYGNFTLDELNSEIKKRGELDNIEIKIFQSNSESEIVELIHTQSEWANFLILNPAAFTHTSVAIRDAILATGIKTIEVHISNTQQREEFRKKSYISDIAFGIIQGFGKYSYLLAIEACKFYRNLEKK